MQCNTIRIEGQVCVDAIRTLHMNTMDTFEFSEECHTRLEVEQLLTECEQMLMGVKMIQELSPKSLDQLVSYGERCSGKLCYSYVAVVVVIIFGRRGRFLFHFSGNYYRRTL